MQKTYCDCCEREIDGTNVGRSMLIIRSQINGKAVNVNISTAIGLNPVFGSNDICQGCVFDAVAQQDRRETPPAKMAMPSQLCATDGNVVQLERPQETGPGES